MKLEWSCSALEFKRPVGTSRGTLKSRSIYELALEINGLCYRAECAPLDGLSPEALDLRWQSVFEERLDQLCSREFEEVLLDLKFLSASFPSLAFAVQCVEAQLKNGEPGLCFDSKYSAGAEGLPINGLVWMGNEAFERTQALDLIRRGFRCLKFKIGVNFFGQSLSLLREVRDIAPEIELRVDANGAFSAEQAYRTMIELRELGVHSIEQPLHTNNDPELGELIRIAPIPVALDESLINRNPETSFDWLDLLKPHYLVLKPTLLGGFLSCDGWIDAAEKRDIGYWFTSMLESPLGLDAIAQYAAIRRSSKADVQFQGLGTGSIYRSETPLSYGKSLEVERAALWRRNIPK